jgi:hypothetical protein
MKKQQVIAEVVKLALTKAPPKTQYECCLISARASIAVGDIPQNDEEFLSAAWGTAGGLFGPAFEAADYTQKSEWIDMCERALREAAGTPLGSY